jgi:hypothetical protein
VDQQQHPTSAPVGRSVHWMDGWMDGWSEIFSSSLSTFVNHPDTIVKFFSAEFFS